MRTKYTTTRRLDEEPLGPPPDTPEDPMVTISFDSERAAEAELQEREKKTFSETDALISVPVGGGLRPIVKEEPVLQPGVMEFGKSNVNILTLTSSILNIGILTVPFAMASTGIIVGCIFLFFATLGSACGFHLFNSTVVHVSKTKEPIFNSSRMSFPFFLVLIDLTVILNCLGIMVSCLIVVGDTMGATMKTLNLGGTLFDHREFWAFISLATMIPLSFVQRLQTPLFFSAVTALITVCVFISISYGLISAKEVDFSFYERPDFMRVFVAVPIFVFFFSSHHHIYTTYHEGIYKVMIPELNTLYPALAISFCLYLMIGLIGYAAYGSYTPQNILVVNEILPMNILLFPTILQITVVLSAILSCPLYIHPCQSALTNLLSHCIPPQCNRFHPAWFYGTTLLLCIVSFSMACLSVSLVHVLSLVGAVGSTGLCYIWPGMLYLQWKWTGHWTCAKVFGVGWVFGGVLVMVSSIIFIVLNEIYRPEKPPNFTLSRVG